MGLFRPYERKTESERSSYQRTRLVPEPEKKQASTSPKNPEVTTPAEATSAASSTASSGKVKVTRRQPVRKSEPTMTRKQAEAARMERLHPNLSPKEQRKADREARYKARAETWDKVEASPERTLARDFVDTRWTITEFLLPAMILVMAAGMATAAWPVLSSMIMLSLWVLLIASFINTWLMWRSFQKVLAARLPGTSTRGLLMYMYNRALMIRRFRRPAPRIKRGEAI